VLLQHDVAGLFKPEITWL